MVRGKIKGSSFERKISRALSLWISGGKNPYLLWRSSTSGARFTSIYNRVTKNHQNFSSCTSSSSSSLTQQVRDSFPPIQLRESGDLCASDQDGFEFCSLFNVEAKFYKKLDLWDLFNYSESKKGQIWLFWFQVKRDSQKANKLPLLIIKQNFKPELCFFACSFCTVFDDLSVCYVLIKDELIVVPLSLLCSIPYTDFIYRVKRHRNYERENPVCCNGASC